MTALQVLQVSGVCRTGGAAPTTVVALKYVLPGPRTNVAGATVREVVELPPPQTRTLHKDRMGGDPLPFTHLPVEAEVPVLFIRAP